MSSLITPIGILSFPALFVAKPPAPGADPRFGLNLLFDKKAQATPAYKALRVLVAQTIDDKWGPGKSRDADFIKKKKLRSPFRPTEEKEYAGYDIPDGIYIAPWSKNKPGIVDHDREDMTVASDVWAGQLARCTVHAFAYDMSGNAGVAFNLNNVQITKQDMPRLDGRKAAADEFGDTSPGGDDDEELGPRRSAPSKSSARDLDDEIPF